MQILAVIQRVAKSVGMQVPTAVFASDQRTDQEFAALANQMAQRIAEDHDWQRLRRMATITGDGTTQAHALPDDYSRMPAVSRLRTTEWELEHVLDHDVWLDWQLRSFSPFSGAWTLLGDRIEILPILTSGNVVKYWYQSDLIVRSEGTEVSATFPYSLPFVLGDSAAFGTAATEFTADADHFQLDWKLLELGMIWQWKANKGFAYAEEMETYELRKAQIVNRERGPRTVTVGRAILWDDVEIAYPTTLRAS
jgi:hypothetical protein